MNISLLYRALYERGNAFLYSHIGDKNNIFTFCNIFRVFILTGDFGLGNNELNGILREILEIGGKKG
jgi:hypothetical protein